MKSQSQFAQSYVRAQHCCAPTCPDAIPSSRFSLPRVAKWSPLFIGVALAIAPSLVANQPATPPDQPRVPILIELFTSEGCSSCPPVDEFVKRMDETQPVTGAQLIVLSEHVDYWDQDGWRDIYSSALITDRQNTYVRALGLKTAYTPQMIVDGSLELKGNSSDLEQAFEKELKVPKIAMNISGAQIEAQSLKAHVEASGAEKHGGEIWIAVALDHAASQVSAGENSGKRLEHVAVVQELKKVGKLDKGKTFAQDVTVKLKGNPDPKNLRVVAFVQEPGEGKVLGAASTKIVTP